MAQAPGATDNGAREVVLYVEDYPLNAAMMRTVFEHRPDLELVIVVDGAAAMAATQHLRPVLLLLDLLLPDCHGTELLGRMRGVPGWEAVPAIAVTADLEFKAQGSDFMDAWHKPLRVPTLLVRLNRVLVPRPGPKRAPVPH